MQTRLNLFATALLASLALAACSPSASNSDGVVVADIVEEEANE